jgi:transketolase
MTELGQKKRNVVALCADLIGSLKFDDFKKPPRTFFFQTQSKHDWNAAGLTIGGKIPFTGTFANFSTGRVYDQIRQSVAYSDKKCENLCFPRGINFGRRWCNTSDFRRYRLNENVTWNDRNHL